MRYLKVSPSKISTFIPSSKKWVGFFLFVFIFLPMSKVEGISPFQEFKNNLESFGYFKLEVIADPKNISPGERFPLYVKIDIGEGWHIYSLYAKGAEEALPTEISLNSDSFIPQGLWEEPNPIIGWDGALGRVVKTHEQIVEFRRWYRAVESLAPGSHEINGSIKFRTCNNKICNLPREMPFKTKINVRGGENR